MHRADRELANQIELAFLQKGLIPKQGEYLSADGTQACALGALGFSGITIGVVTSLNRSLEFLDFLTEGFDSFENPTLFASNYNRLQFRLARSDYGATALSKFNDASRGFRLGYSVAKRMFSKAPTEPSPTRIGISIGT